MVQQFLKIIAICYFRALWKSPGKVGHTDQLHNQTVVCICNYMQKIPRHIYLIIILHVKPKNLKKTHTSIY